MQFRSYKVIVEVTCAASDESSLATKEQVKQAMCELLHEGSEQSMDELSLAVTDVGTVTEHEADPELVANYSEHDK